MDPNINLGPNVHLKDKGVTFCTPLMLAAQECDLQLAQILLKYGADINMRDNLCRNCLFYLLNSEKDDILEFLSFLIKNDVNVNEVDLDGNSPLIIAVNKNMKQILRMLLANGANVDHKVSDSGNTALHIAVQSCDIEVVQIILSYRPNLGIVNKNNETPIELAAQSTRTEVYALLANDYNFRDSKEEDATTSSNINMYSNETPQKSDIINDYQCDKRPNSNLIINNLLVQQILNSNQTQGYNPNNFHKFTKSAKIQKLNYLQEKRLNGKTAKDKIYKFPINQNNNLSNIEIPFNFQNTNENRNSQPGNKGHNNQLHSYISNPLHNSKKCNQRLCCILIYLTISNKISLSCHPRWKKLN